MYAPLALAGHDAGCVPEVFTYQYAVVVDTNPTDAEGMPSYYAIWETYVVGPLFGVWIYEESNGLAGLQRGDEAFANEDCGHGPDSIIY